MALTSKAWIAFLSIAAVAGAAEKERPKFTPGPIASYPARQTSQKVTIAADPFDNESKTATAFGKLNLNRYGITPVLLIMENETGETLMLDRMKVELISPDRQHVEATPANQVKYIFGPKRPGIYSPPVPGLPPHISKGKNPLAAWEIEGRAFAARMLPPKETASGFVYFQTPYRHGSSIYLSGLRQGPSGQELFYFEIPLP